MYLSFASIKLNFKRIYNIIPFKQYLFFLIKKIFKIKNSNIYKHLNFNGYFKTNYLGKSFNIYSTPTKIENDIFWQGLGAQWEPLSTEIWCYLVKNLNYGSVVLDVGANTGIYSILAAKFNKKITIHSFEPNIQFLNSLKKSAIKNQFDINLNNFALTDNYKQLNFDGYAIKSKKSKFLIQGKRLEKYIKEKKLTNISLIKADVEQHEPNLIRGMGPYLKIFKPDFIIEVLNSSNARILNKLFFKLNYKFISIDDYNKKLKNLKKIEKSASFNLLVCKPNTFIRLRKKFKKNFIN